MTKIFTFLLFLLLHTILSAQINLTAISPSTTENFNSLPYTGASTAWTDNLTLANWYCDRTILNISDGSVATVGLHSFGATASTERALGSVGGTTYFAIRLKNNDVQDIVSLDVSFIGEQWRENINASTLEFQYQVANAGTITDANAPTTGWIPYTALDFVDKFHATTQALIGNLPINQSSKSSTIALTATSGQEIWLRWKLVAGTNKCGLSIDNLSITANYPAGCSSPSTQASSMTFSALNTLSFNVGCTTGNGIARLIIGKQGSLPISPAQNDNYSSFDNTTWNTIIPTSNEIPPVGSNQYALYDGIGNIINVSNLAPETQYCFSIFEYLGFHCYNLTPLTGCRYTLSLEPTVNATTLSATSSTPTEIDLNFESMTSAGMPSTNHGYIIIQRSGVNPTDIPADGSGYSSGDIIGNSTVAAIITNPTQTTLHLSGLYDNANYCYKIYSFRWNGSSAETYNYYTPADVPSSCDFVLPIELTSFTIQCENDNIYQLNWTTASELNSHKFIVQRSYDGIQFNDLKTIAAQGNSNQLIYYKYVDTANTIENLYYRLKEISLDSSFSYSKIIYTKCGIDKAINIAYLNNTKQIFLSSNLLLNNQSMFEIIDNVGNIVYKKSIDTFGVENDMYITLPKLASGVYIARLYNQQYQKTYRFFYY